MPSAEASIHLPPIPAKITRGCVGPVALPTGAMSRGDVERLWARDRAALVKCGLSLDAIVAFYEGLNSRLAAADQSKESPH